MGVDVAVGSGNLAATRDLCLTGVMSDSATECLSESDWSSCCCCGGAYGAGAASRTGGSFVQVNSRITLRTVDTH